VYASNGNITIETRPDQIVIITDRFGIAIHLSPADATFVRDTLPPADITPVPDPAGPSRQPQGAAMPDPRELDRIRLEALLRALEACHINGAADADAIVKNAKLFENYLAGEDA